MFEFLVWFASAYLLTGISIVGRDFAMPAVHQKMYVLSGQHGFALVVIAMWPLTTLREVTLDLKLHAGRAVHLLIGTGLLFAGFLLGIGGVAGFINALVGWWFVGYPVAFVGGLLVSPILTATVMPDPRA